jgi:(1->4)-alpha-D-glucan 1-alpha-D-glucosylmutase
MATRATDWSRALLATATHDHKRGEDVRARLAVLSEVPELWRSHVARWNELAADLLDGIDPADAYMLCQTLYGAWPEGLANDDAAGLADFAERVNGWQEKALREGKLRSSWEAPQEEYEACCKALTEALLDPTQSADFLADLADLHRMTEAAAQANMSAQMTLRLTVPGVPDTYQGTELPDYSLVDPDNRRPVDYPAREAALADGGSPKLALMAELLALRRQHPAVFADGDYQPLALSGDRADHVLAFTRTAGDERLLVAVGLRLAGMRDGDWWGDTAIDLDGKMMSVAALFADGTAAARIL